MSHLPSSAAPHVTATKRPCRGDPRRGVVTSGHGQRHASGACAHGCASHRHHGGAGHHLRDTSFAVGHCLFPIPLSPAPRVPGPFPFQKRSRSASCHVRGSPTAVTWLKVGDGSLDRCRCRRWRCGRARSPRSCRLNTSATTSIVAVSGDPERPARAQAHREELVAHAGVAGMNCAVHDRPAGVPCIVVTAGGDVERRRRIGLQQSC